MQICASRFMEKTRILFVTQEITPYLPDSELARIGRFLPQGIQERGKEIRTFLPRFGCINERRNLLHEVIRLSGMNMIINDTDHPLIIKVASIQSARMQVYFIDNEDYFCRKTTFCDASGVPFEDNDERAVFYARGVLETIRKLRWTPHIIHCHGWFSSLVPLYVKKAFREDPIFSKSKVILSLYKESCTPVFTPMFKQKAMTEGVTKKDLTLLDDAPNYVTLSQLAINFSDGIIAGSETIDPAVEKYARRSGKPFLAYHQPKEGEEYNYIDDYAAFYDRMLDMP